MVVFNDLPRKWFFLSESAIYERLGFCGDVCDFPTWPGDNTMRTWRDEKVYRYFWHWGLPPVTFTSRWARIRQLNAVEVVFPRHTEYPSKDAYEHHPALWSEASARWIEIWHSYPHIEWDADFNRKAAGL